LLALFSLNIIVVLLEFHEFYDFAGS